MYTFLWVTGSLYINLKPKKNIFNSNGLLDISTKLLVTCGLLIGYVKLRQVVILLDIMLLGMVKLLGHVTMSLGHV